MQWRRVRSAASTSAPAVGDGQRRRHLDGHVLAPLHGVERNGDMHLPVGAVVDQIDTLQLADATPVVGARELLRRRQAVYRKRPLRPLDVGGHLVAEGDDLHAVELRETLDGVLPRIPRPMKATRTTGIGSQRSCSTSHCPSARAGSAKTIVPSSIR